MTDAERARVDAEPLWTTEAQITWALEQHGGEGLTASQLGKLLRQPSIIATLRVLEQRGAAYSWKVGGTQRWGTRDTYAAWKSRADNDDRRAAQARAGVRSRNAQLAELVNELRDALDGTTIDVSTGQQAFFGRNDDKPDYLIIATEDPEEAAWLLDRLRPDPAEQLEKLLSPLVDAGWEVDQISQDFSEEDGLHAFTELSRTDVAIDVSYQQDARTLELSPSEDVTGERPGLLGAPPTHITIALPRRTSDAVRTVAARAGELGLLDATRIRGAGETSTSETPTADNSELADELVQIRIAEYVLQPAAEHSDVDIDEIGRRLMQDRHLSTYWTGVVAMFGRRVLPDPVPDVAALGIVAWCWRNNTAVEDWHVRSDVLMARINIAATKAVLPHVDLFKGVNWEGVEQALTDDTWKLPGGETVASLFGNGWPEVKRTVTEQLRQWRRADTDTLGPNATLRLLTIGGSTGYTSNWWGQGRWTAMCRAVVDDAIAAGVALPEPYDVRGADVLVRDLADPDNVSDEVLDWLIDLPGSAKAKGPYGLRFHPVTSQQPTLVVDKSDLASDVV
ncbi:hypothetical protein EV385_6703 [Krasilnikovia cinnamomea]|uniref:Uncharacterized protein n=1 Tax=Krasilnikovia cinnamomea TaxID=349313 RepID=A0A4Q7Z7Z9_9ACTN|nr:hypothetical protein [Krasilnikovia cinnamomea]RZU46627.1 hypothetical protein EV385_6703 [Krasilnikovia cinnamomea]